ATPTAPGSDSLECGVCPPSLEPRTPRRSPPRSGSRRRGSRAGEDGRAMAEGERRDDDGSRRKFMLAGAGVLGACVAGISAAPALALLTHPLSTPTTSGSDAYIPVGKLAQFQGSVPVKVDLYADKVDAWNRVVQVKIGS